MSDEPSVTIRVKPHGPHRIMGPVLILDADGNPITPPPAKTPGMIKLCSCGRTATPPFCDSSHNKPNP